LSISSSSGEVSIADKSAAFKKAKSIIEHSPFKSAGHVMSALQEEKLTVSKKKIDSIIQSVRKELYPLDINEVLNSEKFGKTAHERASDRQSFIQGYWTIPYGPDKPMIAKDL
jgi:hypothetical protein